MKPFLYYGKSSKLYYLPDEFYNCDKCGAQLINGGFHKQFLGRKAYESLYLCEKCAQSYRPLFPIIIENNHPFTICDMGELPGDCSAVIPSKQNLQVADNKNLSVFDVSQINKLGGTTEDKTVYAGRESFEGAQIGRADIISELEKQDKKKLTVDEGLSLLDSLGKAKPYIDEDKKDRIGHDGGEDNVV